MIELYSQCASALFAGFAALLWAYSAWIKTPKSFPIKVFVDVGSGSYDGTKPAFGEALSEALDALAVALNKQSYWSGWAAAASSVSAVAQAFAIFAHIRGW